MSLLSGDDPDLIPYYEDYLSVVGDDPDLLPYYEDYLRGSDYLRLYLDYLDYQLLRGSVPAENLLNSIR